MALILLTPQMTWNSNALGSSSADLDNANAWKAFDRSLEAGDSWIPISDGRTTPPHWIKYIFATAQTVSSYRMAVGLTWYAGRPVSWQLQGSVNGSVWVDVDAQTDIALQGAMWSGATTEHTQMSDYITCSNPGSYQYYRLYVTDYEGTLSYPDREYIALYELELYAADTSVLLEVPEASLSFSPQAPEYILGDFYNMPVANLAFDLASPSLIIGPVSFSIPEQVLSFAPNAPGITIVPDASIPSTVIYRCTLTGTPDLTLPIASMQARYRTGESSYLSVVVPDGVTYADEISARADGEIVIQRGVRFFDGSEQLVEIMRVNLEDIRDDWGGNKRSVTLVGHKQTTNTNPKSITLANATYLASGTGKRRIRADIDLNLRPGDTVVYGSISFTVSSISYIASTDGEIMEVMEL